jgi:hypothetical protein
LLLNGLSQGERNNDGNSVFIWQDRELQPGENTIRVTATIKGQSVEDSCVWTFAE